MENDMNKKKSILKNQQKKRSKKKTTQKKSKSGLNLNGSLNLHSSILDSSEDGGKTYVAKNGNTYPSENLKEVFITWMQTQAAKYEIEDNGGVIGSEMKQKLESLLGMMPKNNLKWNNP